MQCIQFIIVCAFQRRIYCTVILHWSYRNSIRNTAIRPCSCTDDAAVPSKICTHRTQSHPRSVPPLSMKGRRRHPRIILFLVGTSQFFFSLAVFVLLSPLCFYPPYHVRIEIGYGEQGIGKLMFLLYYNIILCVAHLL